MTNKRALSGYTLIEVLIVLFIISIITTVGLLSISRNENKQLESFANEFAQMMTLAEEQAMLQPAVLGMSVKEHSVQFASLEQAQAEKKAAWVPLEDRMLSRHSIPNNIQVSVAAGDAAASKDVPQIIISTNGDITPFKVYIGKKGEKPRYAIIGDADGHITSQLLS